MKEGYKYLPKRLLALGGTVVALGLSGCALRTPVGSVNVNASSSLITAEVLSAKGNGVSGLVEPKYGCINVDVINVNGPEVVNEVIFKCFWP